MQNPEGKGRQSSALAASREKAVASRKESYAARGGQSYSRLLLTATVQEAHKRAPNFVLRREALLSILPEGRVWKPILAKACKAHLVEVRGSIVTPGETEVDAAQRVKLSGVWRQRLKLTLAKLDALIAAGAAQETAIASLSSEAEHARAQEVKRLRRLLQPFARMGRKWGHLPDDAPAIFTRADSISMIDFKRAAAALGAEDNGSDEGSAPINEDDLSRYMA